MDTLKQTRATKIQRRGKTFNGVCGDCSAYIGFVHASAAWPKPKVLELKSIAGQMYKCSYFTVKCTLRTRWGGCGMSPTSTGRTLDQRGTGGRVRARSMENPQRAEFSLLPPRNLGASQFFPILKISILQLLKIRWICWRNEYFNSDLFDLATIWWSMKYEEKIQIKCE